MPNKERFVMGMHLYAMDWPKPRNAGEEADAYEYDHTMELVQRLGVTPRLDPTLDAWTFTYTGADGRAREVWYTDASTQATRIGIASERGLGIGVWRLGREDQRLWDDPRLAG
jgi:spore germination protein YaaH